MRGELLDVDGGQRSSTSMENGGMEFVAILDYLLTTTGRGWMQGKARQGKAR